MQGRGSAGSRAGSSTAVSNRREGAEPLKRAGEPQAFQPDPVSLRQPPVLLLPGTRAPMDGPQGSASEAERRGNGSGRTNRRQVHTSSFSTQAGKNNLDVGWRHLTGPPEAQGIVLQNSNDCGPSTAGHTPTLHGCPLCLDMAVHLCGP